MAMAYFMYSSLKCLNASLDLYTNCRGWLYISKTVKWTNLWICIWTCSGVCPHPGACRTAKGSHKGHLFFYYTHTLFYCVLLYYTLQMLWFFLQTVFLQLKARTSTSKRIMAGSAAMPLTTVVREGRSASQCVYIQPGKLLLFLSCPWLMLHTVVADL